ncbi:MAG: FAD-binding protein [bacterium]|nr:FAD-binding protein [bacterium]
MEILHNISLADYTTLKIGGIVRNFYIVRNLVELKQVSSLDHARVLGSGSNILVNDGKLDFDIIKLDGDFKKNTIKNGKISVGAGASLAKVLQETAHAGLSGLEIFAGIPGTVGGAVFGEISTKYGKISDYIVAVNVIDGIIVEVEFCLKKAEPQKIKEAIKKNLIEKVASQPYGKNTAGCVFRNKQGVSSGMLIDQAGLKGRQIGKVKISCKHANFFIADHGASFKDFLALVEDVKIRLNLETEIQIWK